MSVLPLGNKPLRLAMLGMVVGCDRLGVRK